MAFRWRANAGPLSAIWSLFLLNKKTKTTTTKKNKKQKKTVRVGPPQAKLSGYATPLKIYGPYMNFGTYIAYV